MDRKLRIGIDARAATEEPAGRGRYVRELLRALPPEHDYVLFARERWDGAPELAWRLDSAPDVLWHARAARAASRECEVLLSTNSYLTAWFTRIPAVAVVHDAIAWKPEMQPQKRAARIERATAARALRRAAAIACMSASTERDIVERFPTAAGKTRVVPLAVADEFRQRATPAELEDVRRRHGLPPDFILSTGTLEPRKNLTRLMVAHASLPDAPPLLLAGPPGWQLEQALAGATERPGRVRTLGYVPDADLPALYQLCTVFAYPSLYEGFGLPLLEAMAAGAACVTSNVSSLPEVGGDAVLYADPLDTDAIAMALLRALASPGERSDLGRRAELRSREFSWQRTAAETLSLLIRAAG